MECRGFSSSAFGNKDILSGHELLHCSKLVKSADVILVFKIFISQSRHTINMWHVLISFIKHNFSVQLLEFKVPKVTCADAECGSSPFCVCK